MSRKLDTDGRKRSVVTDKEYRRLDAKISEIKDRLNARRGSTIDPSTVEESLQCVMEGRMNMPGCMALAVVDGDDQNRIPYSTAVWMQVAHLPVLMIGCTYDTAFALRHYGKLGHTVGVLLLSTADEIRRSCGEAALRDIAYCLSAQGLSLATSDLLVKHIGWYAELEITNWDNEKVIVRVPRGQLNTVPLAAIRELGHYRSTPTNHLCSTLGDLLAHSRSSLFDLFVSGYPDCGEMWKLELQSKVDAIANWLERNNLALVDE